jgi:hypothetical protein
MDASCYSPDNNYNPPQASRRRNIGSFKTPRRI